MSTRYPLAGHGREGQFDKGGNSGCADAEGRDQQHADVIAGVPERKFRLQALRDAAVKALVDDESLVRHLLDDCPESATCGRNLLQLPDQQKALAGAGRVRRSQSPEGCSPTLQCIPLLHRERLRHEQPVQQRASANNLVASCLQQSSAHRRP